MRVRRRRVFAARSPSRRCRLRGVLSASQLRQLAHVARHFDRGYGHFTIRQIIQFNWPRLEDTPDILAILEADLPAIQTAFSV
jgi:sulfite reductase (NADPH) hemoprotein beta-component